MFNSSIHWSNLFISTGFTLSDIIIRVKQKTLAGGKLGWDMCGCG
jgi:hypothetical protein